MLNKDLGFDKEQLLVIRRMEGLQKKIKPFKEEIEKDSRCDQIDKFNYSTGLSE